MSSGTFTLFVALLLDSQDVMPQGSTFKFSGMNSCVLQQEMDLDLSFPCHESVEAGDGYNSLYSQSTLSFGPGRAGCSGSIAPHAVSGHSLVPGPGVEEK